MTTSTIYNGRVLGGRLKARGLLHRGACGDWYDSAPIGPSCGGGLPTEFAHGLSSSSSKITLILRETVIGEMISSEAAGVHIVF